MDGQIRLGKTRKEAEEYVLEMRREYSGKAAHVPEGPNAGGTKPPGKRWK